MVAADKCWSGLDRMVRLSAKQSRIRLFRTWLRFCAALIRPFQLRRSGYRREHDAEHHGGEDPCREVTIQKRQPTLFQLCSYERPIRPIRSKAEKGLLALTGPLPRGLRLRRHGVRRREKTTDSFSALLLRTTYPADFALD